MLRSCFFFKIVKELRGRVSIPSRLHNIEARLDAIERELGRATSRMSTLPGIPVSISPLWVAPSKPEDKDWAVLEQPL